MKIVIVQRVLPHYRVAMFSLLHERLRRDGSTLDLVYGQEYSGTVPRTVAFDAPWGHKIRNRYITLTDTELVWQPCLALLKEADLVIVEQANRLLVNYLLIALRHSGRFRLAYWGHGRNMQNPHGNRVRERLKRVLTCSVDWWFSYTQISADTVASAGYPHARITVLQNAVDTHALNKAISEVDDQILRDLSATLGINGSPCGIYCGGMYAYKNIDFLINACLAVKARVPDFHMILIGDGPESRKVESAARAHPWIHFPGPLYGDARAPYFRLSQALLMPRLVGLAILDSFAAGVPMFTTSVHTHGPEIAYLENGVNGVMTAPDVECYADAVAAFLLSPEEQARLRQGCTTSAQKYSVENMVENFATGILHCLSGPRLTACP